MIVKPATTKVPIIAIADGTIASSPHEIVSIHYFNSTAGAGRVTITDGSGEPNKGIVLGSDAANGSDRWEPAQPASFDKIIVTFTTGTGIVTIQTN